MRKLLVIIMIVYSATGSFGQGQDSISRIKKTPLKRYWNFLKQDTVTFAPFILAGLNYLYTTPGKVNNTGHGLGFSLGFNAARLFTKKFVLGGFSELKIGKGWLWSYNFTSDFHSDLNSYGDYSGLDHNDSLYASEFVKITGENNLYGSAGGRYGFMFCLPKKRWVEIKIYKKGVYDLLYDYTFLNKNYNMQDEDYIELQHWGYGIEILKVFLIKNFPCYFTLFYERDDFSEGSIHSGIGSNRIEVKLNSFLKPDFFNKYGTANRFGFKIGLGNI